MEFWTVPDEKIVVETEFEELRDFHADTATVIMKQDMILSLLSMLSNNLFFYYHDLSGNWGMPVLKDDPGEEANSWSSKWCLAQFHFPELPKQLQITEFSLVEIRTIKYYPHKFYYTQDPDLDFLNNKEIVFPHTAENILDAYFNLDISTRQVVDSAISHLINSMEFRLHKKTTSLLCSFTAVETMIDLEFAKIEAERCVSCGQLKYSIAKKFRDFLLKYVATGEENKSKYNKYYSLRSKIVHTGRHLESEKLFSEVPKSKRDSDLLTQVEVLQLSKLAVVNWLLLNDSKN